MKKFLLFASATVLAFSAMGQSKNGQVVNGELILEDFEGAEPEMMVVPITLQKEYRDQDIHLCDKGVKEYKGSKMAYGLSAYFHRLAADPMAEGPWSSDAATLFVKVTLPEGKSLGDYTDLKMDFANYDPATTSANQYHKMYVTAGDPDVRAEAFKKDFTEHETISNGEIVTMVSNMEEQSDLTGYNCIMYDPYAWKGSFFVAYSVQHNACGYYIDNIRLAGAGEAGVENVAAAKVLKVYGTVGGIRVAGDAEVAVYTLAGAQVVAKTVVGNELVAVPAGAYVVVANGAATKVLVK